MKNQIVPLALVAAAIALAPACATKSYVNKNVGEVNTRVDNLTRSVEGDREKARQMDGRISEVDKTAQGAQQSAQRAQGSATDAGAKADAVNKRVDAVEAAAKRVVLTVVINESEGKFGSGKTAVPETAKAKLDELATKAKEQGAWIEIEGHTDNVGPKEYNHKIGLERAEAVKRYFYEQHQIPLHRMNVISYGPDKPAVPNKTRDGRAQNRRVVVKLLS